MKNTVVAKSLEIFPITLKDKENSFFQENIYSENIVYYSAYNCVIVQ